MAAADHTNQSSSSTLVWLHCNKCFCIPSTQKATRTTTEAGNVVQEGISQHANDASVGSSSQQQQRRASTSVEFCGETPKFFMLSCGHILCAGCIPVPFGQLGFLLPF
jgi:hypothetical protein